MQKKLYLCRRKATTSKKMIVQPLKLLKLLKHFKQ